jgi:hypothetical protein
MSKKTFSGGLDSLLGELPNKPKLGRSITSTREITKSSQEGTKENETRATFIVREDYLEKIKSMAYWESLRLTIETQKPTTVFIKDIINTALGEAIERHEKKFGPIKPIK